MPSFLMQRKCACASHAGSSCEACSEKGRFLQPKLGASTWGDRHEQEADRVAEQVTSWSLAAHREPPRIGRVHGTGAEVPASVDRAVTSPGRPLEPGLREDMERRFGHDFSRVRVHSGAEAGRSAQDVAAEAYTIGHDIVFGPGRLAPETSQGRRLMAHELTHVVQQRGGPAAIQRQSAPGGTSIGLTIGDVDIKSADPNCQYQPGEEARSQSPKGILDYDIERGEFLHIEPPDAVVVADFVIGHGELRPSTTSTFRKYWTPTFDAAARGGLEIVGYSDCAGWESRNAALRDARARAVGRLLPGVVTRAAPVDEFPIPNTSERTRALNRSAIIKRKPQPPPPPPPPRKHEVTITQEEPPTKNCSAEQRRQLSIAFPAAKLMAERGRAALFSTKNRGVTLLLLNRYFGADAPKYLAEIRAGYTKILDNWGSWDPQFECLLQTEDRCPSKDPHFIKWAYVMRKKHVFSPPTPYGSVHVCAAAFASAGNMQQLSMVVLHELSHRLDNTDDEKYCEAHRGYCEDLSTKDAVDNADSYARFAQEIFNISL